MPHNEPGQQNVSVKKDAGINTVYGEFYTEMRRFRDYEFKTSAWYNTALLAILGFVVSVKMGDADAIDPLFALAITLAAAILCVVAITIVHYCHSRYDLLRKWADTNLEPSWKKEFAPPKKPIQPHMLFLATPAFFLLAILFALFCIC